MRPDDILHWLRAVPFRPFRVCLNSGRTFDIRHPEMVKVGRTTINIFEFTSDEHEVYEKMQMVGLVLIERIEPISSSSAA